jgi:hypothetical protein
LQKKTLLAVLSGLSTKILKGLNATLTLHLPPALALRYAEGIAPAPAAATAQACKSNSRGELRTG